MTMTDERTPGLPMYEAKPTPDPTVLTTEQLLREVERVKELVLSKIEDLKELAKAQTTGDEKVLEEKLASVKTQFELIERQRVEQKKDTKDAVDAALAAAKEAVGEQKLAQETANAKTEKSTADQLVQLNGTLDARVNGVISTLEDLKERQAKTDQNVSNILAGRQGGATEVLALQAAQSAARDGQKYLVQILAFVLAVVVAGFTIYATTHK